MTLKCFCGNSINVKNLTTLETLKAESVFEITTKHPLHGYVLAVARIYRCSGSVGATGRREKGYSSN